MTDCMQNGVALGILSVIALRLAYAVVSELLCHRRHQRQERDRWRNETFKKPGEGE